MKKIITILTAICCSLFTYANTITVSNNSNSPGQYTDLQVAIDAATTLSGDTILVAGSPISYGGIIINDKKLHLIGIGSNPNKQFPFPSTIAGVTFSYSPPGALNSSGSTIEGFYINAISLDGTTNITISRCEINTIAIYSDVQNILIYNNLFYSLSKSHSGNNIFNIIIVNNIIRGNGIFYQTYSSTPNNVNTIEINNNLFNGISAIAQCYNGNFTNNVFYATSPHTLGHSYCNFINNLSYATTIDTFYDAGTNSGVGNLEGQNPLFVNEIDFSFTNTDDFNTPSNSPVHNAGTDGTDIGIYGGAYPWPEGDTSGTGFMYSQEPQFPQVNEMNINNLTIPVGGILNVTSTGIKNN